MNETNPHRRFRRRYDGIRRRRRATIYDAIAGRVSSTGINGQKNDLSGFVNTSSTSDSHLRPDEVLFKRKNAPLRYLEDDIYHRDDSTALLELPSSDLSLNIHYYASKYFSGLSRTSQPGSESCFEQIWTSLDGSSLLLLGILMEEALHVLLKESGELSLTEPINNDGGFPSI